jgi:outer membrane protein assembly factor BamB
LYAIHISNGSIFWNYSTGDGIFSSPSTNGINVVVGSDDGYLYSFNISQSDLNEPKFFWRFKVNSSIKSSPALTQSQVFVGAENGNIYCIDLVTGSLHWNYTTEGSVTSSPTIINQKLFLGSSDGKIYCFGPPPDTVPPNVRIIEPTTGAVVKGRIYVNGTAMSNEIDLKITRVQVKVGNEPDWHLAKTVDDWKTWTYKLDTTKFSNGEQTVYSRAFDGVKYSNSTEVKIILKNPEIFLSNDDPTNIDDFFPIILGFIAVIVFFIIIIVVIIISRKGKHR